MANRIGVDLGGTYTDLIVYDDDDGSVRVAKVSTQPGHLEESVLNALSVDLPPGALKASSFFLHGTTVGLNALLEQKGACVGLITTRGFRDVLEIGRGDRLEIYKAITEKPPVLVPRWLRLPVTERVRFDGSVHIPLVEADVSSAYRTFEENGVECIAIAFLNAYVNPVHELAVERSLRALGFQGEIAMSHSVSREYREYERTSTTVIDAFIRPRTRSYIRSLRKGLNGMGFAGRLFMTRSGGGALTFDEAEARPVETILSGPVGGAQAAAELAQTLRLGDVITADVGGTSFDTCLITGGVPHLAYEGRVAGHPVQTAWVDVRSIGAGGGSIAYVDAGGLLQVGPESAGAYPGPASYGRGGTKPTVTDAALILGLLGRGLLAGDIHLDIDTASNALESLTGQLVFQNDRTPEENLARGILTIASSHMADAMREITVELGHDPRDMTLIAFGGAGPVFATMLAHNLGIGKTVIPLHAGNFSAWGLLGADLTRTAARTRILRLSSDGITEANAILADLFAELESLAESAPASPSNIRESALDMRFVGQEHTITTPLTSAGDGRITLEPDELTAQFLDQYARTFGHTNQEDVEIVTTRATVRTPLPPRRLRKPEVTSRTEEKEMHFRTYSLMRDEWLDFRVLDRISLVPGVNLPGPALIHEQTATTYVDHGWVTEVHESGSLILSAAS